MNIIKIYNNETLLGSIEMMIPEYQAVPYWNRNIQLAIIAKANDKFGTDWTHTKIEEAAL